MYLGVTSEGPIVMFLCLNKSSALKINAFWATPTFLYLRVFYICFSGVHLGDMQDSRRSCELVFQPHISGKPRENVLITIFKSYHARFLSWSTSHRLETLDGAIAGKGGSSAQFSVLAFSLCSSGFCHFFSLCRHSHGKKVKLLVFLGYNIASSKV